MEALQQPETRLKGFLPPPGGASSAERSANPHRIKAAAHRHRTRTTGHRVYANDNPVRYTDPDGRYACDSGASGCSTVKDYYRQLQKAAQKYYSPERSYGRVQGVMNYLGKPGDFNGVTIAVVSFSDSPAVGNNDKHTINLDVGKISSAAKSDVWGSRNEAFSTAGLANAIGSGVLAHEAQHGVDARNSGWGWPTTRGQEMGTEVSAYSTESLIQGALHVDYGLWGNGVVPSTIYKAIRRSASASTDVWCDNSPGAEGC